MHPIGEEGADGSADVLIDFGTNNSYESLFFKHDLIQDIFESPELGFIEDFREYISEDDTKDYHDCLALPSLDPAFQILESIVSEGVPDHILNCLFHLSFKVFEPGFSILGRVNLILER